MNDLPPKSVNVQIVRLDDSLKRIERSQFAGIQRAPGSLPVLEAFQLFLEHERKKNRRRIVLLSVCSVLTVMVAAAGGVALVRSQMRKAADELRRVSSRTDELATMIADTEKRDTPDIAAIETRFSEESRRIVAQYDAMLAEQTTLSDQIKNRGDILESLQQRLERLESGTGLAEPRLDLLPTKVDSTEAAVSTLASESLAEMHTEPEQNGPPGVAPEQRESQMSANANVTVTEHPAALLWTIVPEGQTEGIRWQLPRSYSGMKSF